MRFSTRSTPFDGLPFAASLLGLLLVAPSDPARADGGKGRIESRDFVEERFDFERQRAKLLFGDEKSPDPVIDRRGLRGRGDADGFAADEESRRRVAEELLDGLEERFNEGRWIPFRHPKATGPEILKSLDGLAEAEAQAQAIPDASWRSRFRLSLVRGLEYRQDFSGPDGDRKMQMRLFGPVVPGGPGLGFQLRGDLFDHRMRIQGYGGPSEAGITFDLEF